MGAGPEEEWNRRKGTEQERTLQKYQQAEVYQTERCCVWPSPCTLVLVTVDLHTEATPKSPTA